MELPVGKKQSKEFWKAHVEACAVYPGSVSAYCTENGLGKSRFTYHRQKVLNQKSKFAEVKAIGAPPVTMEPPRESADYLKKLPDPGWLAALIRELSR